MTRNLIIKNLIEFVELIEKKYPEKIEINQHVKAFIEKGNIECDNKIYVDVPMKID